MENTKTKPITERINSFDDVLELTKPAPEALALINYNGTDRHLLAARAALRAFLVSEAYCEGKEADWTDGSAKWAHVWNMEPSAGSGFSYSNFVSWHSGTRVGSRLWFPNRECSDDAAQKFSTVFHELLNRKNQ